MIISRLSWAGEKAQGFVVHHCQSEGERGTASIGGSPSPREQAGCKGGVEICKIERMA